MARPLKLYVWEDVLRDHTAGVAFALARDVAHARRLVAHALGYEHDDLKGEPRVVTKAEGFAIHGGG